MKNKKYAVGLACQIVFEYEGWGDEHIMDMLATFEPASSAPCTGFELQDLCGIAQRHKTAGLDCSATNKEMMRKKGGKEL